MPDIAAQKLIDYAARLGDAERYLPEEVDTLIPGATRFRDDLLEMRDHLQSLLHTTQT